MVTMIIAKPNRYRAHCAGGERPWKWGSGRTVAATQILFQKILVKRSSNLVHLGIRLTTAGVVMFFTGKDEFALDSYIP